MPMLIQNLYSSKNLKNKIMVWILVFCIVTNGINFFDSFINQQGNLTGSKISKINISQELNYLIDVVYGYQQAQKIARDVHVRITIENILNAAHHDPKRTLIVVRDVEDDDGFNWKKARYGLPEYDIYYLFDSENTNLEDKTYVWHAHDGGYNISASERPNIDLNP